MKDLVKLVFGVGPVHPLHELGQAVQRPPVQLLQPVIGLRVPFRVKIVAVAQQEAAGIADLAVDLRQLLQNFRGEMHVAGKIRRGDPEAQDVGAVVADHLFGGDDVAQGLGHLLPLAVHHPAVAEDGSVWGLAAVGHGGQQGGLEPAPVLVAPLQVEVCRPVKVGPVVADRQVAGAGIEPDIHGILLLDKGAVAAAGAGIALRKDLLRLPDKPGVGPLPGKELGYRLQGALLHDGLPAAGTVEDGQGDSPDALAGDAPVLALPDHVVEALFAPGRDPLHPANGRQGLLPEAVHRGKPLLRGPEDDGILAAPAVGVLVLQLPHLQERLLPLQGLDYSCIALVVAQAAEFAGFLGEAPLLVHGAEDLQAVEAAYVIVFLPVAGSGMHAAGALFQGHMVRQDDGTFPIHQGVAVFEPLQPAAREASQHLPAGGPQLFLDALQQPLRQEVALRSRLHQHVFQVGVQGDGQVAGDGPGGGGPGQTVGILRAPQQPLVVGNPELDIYGIGAAAAVLDLRLRQGRFALRAPVNGLQALVDKAAGSHGAKNFNLAPFEGGIQGDVGVVPVPQHPQALELLPL